MDEDLKHTLIALVIAVVFIALLVGTPLVLTERNSKARCELDSTNLNMRWRYSFGNGCEVDTPEYGWTNLSQYITQRGIQSIREGK